MGRQSMRENTFGYNWKKPSSGQLKKALNMEDKGDEFCKIISTIQRLAREALDTNEKGYIQNKKLGLIEKALIKKYPDIFGAGVEDHKTRLYYAYKHVLYIHAVDRSKQKLTKQNSQEGKKTAAQSDSTSSSPPQASLSPPPKDVNNNKENIPLPGSSGTTLYTEQRVTQNPSTSNNFVDDYSSLSRAPSSSQRSNIFNECSPRKSGPSYCYAASNTQTVHRFLDSCVPSMAHHIDSFLDFGCDRLEFLLGVSGWPPSIIRSQLLDVLPANQHGERLTEMEKRVIQQHILTSFKS